MKCRSYASLKEQVCYRKVCITVVIGITAVQPLAEPDPAAKNFPSLSEAIDMAAC